MNSARSMGVAATVGLSALGLLAFGELPAVRSEPAATAASADETRAPSVQLATPVTRLLLATASRDPFNLAIAPPVPPPVVQAPPAPTPPPVIPVFPYQVFGRLQEPDGTWRIYLSLEQRLVPVEKGTELELGYRVDDVTDSELVIRHVPSGQHVRSTWATE